MPSIFDSKYFNPEVFGRYLETVPRVKQNAFISSGIFRTRNDLRNMLADQTGGNYVTIPMIGRIGGEADNYNGSDNMTGSGIDTYAQSMIVVGRMHYWSEKDFSYDITGGHDFMADIAAQLADYKDDLDNTTILKELEGIFGVTADGFASKHTLDVTGTSTGKVTETTLMEAVQKAFGANRALASMVIMHSVIATNLEKMEVLEYRKYTDAQGIQRQIELADWNGKTVLIDDEVPISYPNPTYSKTSDVAVVEGKTYYTRSGTSGNYVYTPVDSPEDSGLSNYYEVTDLGDPVYTTYILGQGAFDYCDCGAKNPYTTSRDEITAGGIDKLHMRQRKLFAPHGFSFVMPTPAIVSPTDEQLATAANWTVVTNTAGTGYYNTKAIPFARIISKG